MIRRRTFIAGAAATVVAPRVAWAQQRLPRVALLDRGKSTANMTEESYPWWGLFSGRCANSVMLRAKESS